MMLQSPFTAIVSGSTGSGKSRWLMKLIKNADKMIDERPKHIMYCYSEINPEILRLTNEGVEIFHGAPTTEQIMGKPKNLLLILDDLAGEIDPKQLDMLYTKGERISYLCRSKSLLTLAYKNRPNELALSCVDEESAGDVADSYTGEPAIPRGWIKVLFRCV